MLSIHNGAEELGWEEREKLIFPRNLMLYPGLANACLEAIDYAGQEYKKQRQKSWPTKIGELLGIVEDMEYHVEMGVRRIPFAVTMATLAHTQSKLAIGTRY